MAVSKVMETFQRNLAAILCDDILFEILLRLPDSRSALRCATVSKRWLSLISDPKFISAFIHHHRRHRSHSLYTLIHSYEDPIFSQFHHHDSAKPLLISEPSTNDLNFLPWPKASAAIRASFGDLMLVSNADSAGCYCVCNPVTRQCLALPKAPAKGSIFGLVCEAKSCNDQRCNCSIQYKVCLISFSHNYAAKENVFHATTFCSEAGQWSQRPSILTFPGDENDHKSHVAVSNGVLHWLLWDHGRVTGIATYHPFKDPEKASSVAMPRDFGLEWPRSYMDNTFLGVILGRLRLSQLYTFRGVGGFVLKAWELDCVDFSRNIDSSSWSLVHDCVVERVTKPRMYVTGFDPNDGDVVFMLHGLDILRCEIGAASYECRKVGEFPATEEGGGIREKRLYYDTLSEFNVFGLVHPCWPTRLPELP